MSHLRAKIKDFAQKHHGCACAADPTAFGPHLVPHVSQCRLLYNKEVKPIKIIAFFVLIYASLLLTACGDGGEAVPVFQPEISVVQAGAATTPEILTFDLNIEVQEFQLARHEPTAGAFIGAHISHDAAFESIRAFESEIGVEHAIFAYKMKLGDEYPVRWVLENLAAGKAPFITLMPPDDISLLNTHSLMDILQNFAAEAGRFNMPIFVELFPMLSHHGFSPHDYISFFQTSRTVFDYYAPNVALVWGFDAENLAESAHFYPGRDSVDWIHLKVYNNIDVDGAYGDLFNYIDFFYFAYQQERPLMVSFGVSHHAADSNRYFIREAAEKIEYIYGRLVDYPRIKAVIYRSYNEPGGGKFGLRGADAIMTAYVQAASSAYFLGFVSNFQTPRQDVQVMRSPFRAVMRDGYYYIPKRALVYDARFLPKHFEDLEGLETEIGGDIFFSMAHLNRIMGVDFFVDMQRQTLTLR